MDIFEDLQLNGGDSNDGWAVKTFNLLDRNGRLAATLKKDDFTITYSNGEEDTTATSRCMPFKQDHIADTCVCCGKPAKALVYWGKAY